MFRRGQDLLWTAPVPKAPLHRRAQIGEFEVERRLRVGILLRGD